MDFKIVNMRKITNGQAPLLAAEFSIETADLIIRGFTLRWKNSSKTDLWPAGPRSFYRERGRDVSEGIVQVKEWSVFDQIAAKAQEAYCALS